MVSGSLLVRDLLLRTAGATRLDVAAFEARAGRVVAVTGSSGAGKTTLLSVLGGLVAPTSGTVSFESEPVGTRGGEPRAGTALILQSRALVASLTVEENVAIALLTGQRLSASESVERAMVALERVGAADLANRLIQELSGGQLQRVSIARALAVQPDVLLADEPTTEVDEANRDSIVAELRREAERGAVVVVATHDEEVTARCDEELHLVDGRAVFFGRAGQSQAVEPGREHDAFRRPE